MRLTLYTDYSLRLLLYLALRPDGRATVAEVATAYGISRNHLVKVAHELGQAGFVAATRGKGGGLVLARPATEVKLGEVVRHTEPDMALVPCFAPLHGPCPITGACGLIGPLEEATQAFLAVLDRYSLAEAARQPGRLRAMLGMPEPAAPAA